MFRIGIGILLLSKSQPCPTLQLRFPWARFGPVKKTSVLKYPSSMVIQVRLMEISYKPPTANLPTTILTSLQFCTTSHSTKKLMTCSHTWTWTKSNAGGLEECARIDSTALILMLIFGNLSNCIIVIDTTNVIFVFIYQSLLTQPEDSTEFHEI
jgi:hypothetical protein